MDSAWSDLLHNLSRGKGSLLLVEGPPVLTGLGEDCAPPPTTKALMSPLVGTRESETPPLRAAHSASGRKGPHTCEKPCQPEPHRQTPAGTGRTSPSRTHLTKEAVGRGLCQPEWCDGAAGLCLTGLAGSRVQGPQAVA